MTKKLVDAVSKGEVETVDLEELIRARLNEYGQELLNPTPIAPPIGYKPAPTIREQIRDMIRSEQLAAAFEGVETFEEADDFEVGDDFEHLPLSGYEPNFDPIPDPREPAQAPPASPPPPAAVAPESPPAAPPPAPVASAEVPR